MIERSVKAFVSLFEPHNKQKLPLFKMDLTFDDEKMDFYPSFQDLEDAVLDILNSIINTMQVRQNYVLIIFMWFQQCSYEGELKQTLIKKIFL